MRSTHSPPPPPRASRTARNRVTLTRSVGTYESSDSSAVHVQGGARLTEAVPMVFLQLWRRPSCATVVFAPLTSRTRRSTQLLAAAERSAGLRPPTNVKPLPP